MTAVIDQQLANHEKADALRGKSDKLAEDAGQFKRQATTVKNIMWWKNVKLLAVIIGVVVLVIVVIIIIIVLATRK